MTNEPKRRRGAPCDNQNARKHGLYSRVLDKHERKALKQAASVEGVDEEIALLRLKLKSALSSKSPNTRLIEQIVLSLVRLLRVKKKLNFDANEILKAAIVNVLTDGTLPDGTDSTQDSPWFCTLKLVAQASL